MSETTLTLVQFLRDGIDPVPELAQLRAERPVSELVIPLGPTSWLVTGYAQARYVLGDSKTFSNDFANLADVGAVGGTEGKDPGGLGFADPPEHTRLRRLLTPQFTVKRLRELGPRIVAIVEGCLDDMAEAESSSTDLLSAFAQPVPSLVICELLGVPRDERADFQKISNNRFDLSGALTGGLDAVSESLEYLGDLVVRQRAEPGDGLLGRMIREHGDELTDRELAGLADGLLTGGYDTTASMLALGTVLLLERPELREAALDPGRIGRVVEELLRYISVVQVGFPRFARHDTELGGQRIGAGDMVVCSLSGANRDPGLGEDMERVDPSREASSPHVAFGYGIHHCVGAQLARQEMVIAFPALLRRFPTLRLAVPAEELPYRTFSIVYGVEELPVSW